MEWIKLIGIVIIVIGFVLKMDTIATVVLAGFVTTLVSGISVGEFLTILGEKFVEQRIVTLFFIALPMLGLAEKYGLKQQAVRLISSVKGLSTGGLLTLYQGIREVARALSIELGGHPQFVRPLIQPMAQAAAMAKYGELDEDDVDKIKARSAASDNFGNFFAQNTFAASGGVLLISGFLSEAGYPSNIALIARASIPVALIVLVISFINNSLLDQRLKRKYGQRKGE